MLALVALLGFTAFVVDQGVMLVSRRAAQNAADAGALAGVVSLLEDGGTEAAAEQSARHFSGQNAIWGQSNPATNVDVTFSKSGTALPPCGESPGCVRVDVYRNMPRRGGGAPVGNPIPTYFGHLVGIDNQGVRATATAEAASANANDCLKPWIIPDIWYDAPTMERSTFPDTFDRYVDCAAGGECRELNPDPNQQDVYVPPGSDAETGPGSGFQTPLDVGRQVTLKAGDPLVVEASVFFRLDLDRADGLEDGADNEQYRANISGSCNGIPITIGQIVNEPGCVAKPPDSGCPKTLDGSTDGPTWQEVKKLVDADPTAVWDTTTNSLNSPYGLKSPRVIALPVYDPDHFKSQWYRHGSEFTLRIVNIVGMFIESYQKDPSRVTGRFMSLPGLRIGTGTNTTEASFLKVVRLVR